MNFILRLPRPTDGTEIKIGQKGQEASRYFGLIIDFKRNMGVSLDGSDALGFRCQAALDNTYVSLRDLDDEGL